MRRVGLHHVDIVVSSLERSLPLYRDLLEPLGYGEAYEVVGERGDAAPGALPGARYRSCSVPPSSGGYPDRGTTPPAGRPSVSEPCQSTSSVSAFCSRA